MTRTLHAPTEAEFQKVIIDYAHLHGWSVAHFRAARTVDGWRTPVAADGAGFPDLLLVRERVVAIEVKSETGKVAPEQDQWLKRLASAGIECRVIRPSQWFLVEQMLAPHPVPMTVEQAAVLLADAASEVSGEHVAATDVFADRGRSALRTAAAVLAPTKPGGDPARWLRLQQARDILERGT